MHLWLQVTEHISECRLRLYSSHSTKALSPSSFINRHMWMQVKIKLTICTFVLKIVGSPLSRSKRSRRCSPVLLRKFASSKGRTVCGRSEGRSMIITMMKITMEKLYKLQVKVKLYLADLRNWPWWMIMTRGEGSQTWHLYEWHVLA